MQILLEQESGLKRFDLFAFRSSSAMFIGFCIPLKLTYKILCTEIAPKYSWSTSVIPWKTLLSVGLQSCRVAPLEIFYIKRIALSILWTCVSFYVSVLRRMPIVLLSHTALRRFVDYNTLPPLRKKFNLFWVFQILQYSSSLRTLIWTLVHFLFCPCFLL